MLKCSKKKSFQEMCVLVFYFTDACLYIRILPKNPTINTINDLSFQIRHQQTQMERVPKIFHILKTIMKVLTLYELYL